MKYPKRSQYKYAKRSRTFAGQRAEVLLASKILNTMTSLGMADSYRVA